MGRHLIIAGLLTGLIACDDTVYRSGINVGDPVMDASMDAPDPEPGAVLPEDVGPPIELSACVVELVDEDGEAFSCDIDVREMLGCDALARCMCGFALERNKQGIDLEQCVMSLVFPRGALSLADFCMISGSAINPDSPNLASLGEIIGLTDVFVPGSEPSISFSTECEEIAAFTLWGDAPGVDISLSRDMAPWPDPPEFSFDPPALALTPPMVTYDDIASYERATATIRLTERGAQRLGGLWSDPDIALVDLVGWPLAIHTEDALLIDGQLWSRTLSRTVEGTIIYLEDTFESDFLALRLEQQTPELGPVDPTSFEGEVFRAHMAAGRKLLDSACVSTCGCPDRRACRDGVCAELPVRGCLSDGDCCLGICIDGVCE